MTNAELVEYVVALVRDYGPLSLTTVNSAVRDKVGRDDKPLIRSLLNKGRLDLDNQLHLVATVEGA